MGYDIIRTCEASPEQYEVFKDGDQVGYMRLRHGSFYASIPGSGGRVVFTASPKGDGLFDDDERLYYLTRAIEAIDGQLLEW